jgi:hypothetical protein
MITSEGIESQRGERVMSRLGFLGGSALLIGLTLASELSRAESPTAVPATIAAMDLQTDVDILERAYREMHPGLLRYLSPRQVDQSFGTLRHYFTRSRTVAEAYLALARFTATLRCGHTYANFFNQSKSIQYALFEQTPRLPFYFKWIDRKIVVTRDFTSTAQLPVGAEVIRINGISTDAILDRLLPLARADGSNDAKRIDQLGITGDSLYESFDLYYPLVFRLKAGNVTLVVRAPGKNRARSISVSTITHAERIAPIMLHEEGRRAGSEPLFEWQDLPDGAAILRMPTWAMYNSRWAWKPWLLEHLDALAQRQAAALIIDLRGNEGGDDVGDEILKRLVATDLALAGMKRLVRYRAVPDDLLPYLDTWDPSFKNWGNQATELESPWPTAPSAHYLALAGEDPTADARTVIHPVLPHFAGRVFVLVDAANSSATFQFAQIVQQHKLGTLIGEPTGGNRRGINGGAFFFLRLPHSGVELDLPVIGTFPRTPEPDEGLIPHVIVRTTVADITAGRDAALTAAERLLAQAL